MQAGTETGRTAPAREHDPLEHWARELDRAILEARGRYAVLAEIAEAHNRKVAGLLARWHVLRGAH